MSTVSEHRPAGANGAGPLEGLVLDGNAEPIIDGNAEPIIDGRVEAVIDGRVEAVIEGRVIGWAWCPEQPSARVRVVVVLDGRPLAGGLADQRRESLAEDGIGDGVHAFGIDLPETVGDGRTHAVRVVAGAARAVLPASKAFTAHAAPDSSFSATTFVPVDHPVAPPPPARDLGAALRHRLSSLAPTRANAPTWLLAVGCAAWIVLALYMTRHFGFFQDEYDYIVNRRGWGPNTLLAPVNQHLFVLPLLVYKVLFVTIGLGTHWPYQLPVFACHIACVAGVYALAAHHAGRWRALVPALLLLVLGAGFELELWVIGMSAVGALAAGLWAILLIERDERRADRWACVLLVISMASFSDGLFILAAVVVQLALMRWRRLWVVGIPLLLYAAWYMRYGQGDVVWSNLSLLGSFIPQLAAYAFGGLVGFSSRTSGTTALTIGYLLLGAVALYIGSRIVRERSVPRVALVGILAALGYWLGIGLARANAGEPDASRYVYPSAVMILIAAAGFMRAGRTSWRGGIAIAGAIAVIAVLGLHTLATYASDRDAADTYERVTLGAAQVAGTAGDPAFVPDTDHLPWLELGPYLTAVHALGSPAFTPSQLADQSLDYQLLADSTLIRGERIEPRPAGPPPAGASCARLLGAPAVGTLAVSVDPGGAAYIEAGGAVEVWLRRISPSFPADPLTTLRAGSRVSIAFPRDTSSDPWSLQLAAAGPPAGGRGADPLATACVSAAG